MIFKINFCIFWAALFFSAVSSATLKQSLAPEKDSLVISKHLKGLSNEDWTRIAGERAQEKYQVLRGDNLWDISKRLFGDGFYWPKIWSLNNGAILNPHWISPGNAVNFYPGSASTLPSVGLQVAEGRNSGASSSTDASPLRLHRKTSSQWQELPNQRWENVLLKLPPNIDPDGFDRNNKMVFHRSTGLRPTFLAFSKHLKTLGKVMSATSPTSRLSLGDLVVLDSTQALEVGAFYSITSESSEIRKKLDRAPRGYSYQIKGVVVIKEKVEGGYIAEITQSSAEIERGDLIAELFKPFRIPDPTAAPKALKAILFFTPEYSSANTAQFRTVYLDKGSKDGIEKGMVFRHYPEKDPSTKKTLPASSFYPAADFLVIDASENICTALVFQSTQIVDEHEEVTLLTDVSSLLSGAPAAKPDLTVPADGTPTTVKENEKSGDKDNLDDLDDGGELSDQEKKELEQLEKWKENPPEAPTALPLEEVPLATPKSETVQDELPPSEGEDSDDFEDEDTTPTPAPSAPGVPPVDAPLPDQPSPGQPGQSNDDFEE